jgi:mycofactocin precursor
MGQEMAGQQVLLHKEGVEGPADPGDDEELVENEELVETVWIDGMCGVY